MNIGSLPDGARGFDANRPLSDTNVAHAIAERYAFVVRYVRRSEPHTYDLSADEAGRIIGGGLALMTVQHVAQPGWYPSGDVGQRYGAIAAAETSRAGVPPFVSTWCDLEGVARDAKASDVAAFCNAWHEEVSAAGYLPGLYVGDSAGLSALALFHDLAFDAYWSAYNLNRDAVPAVRGAQMVQSVARAVDWIPGFDSQTMDVDTIHTDALGGSPTLYLPLERLPQ